MSIIEFLLILLNIGLVSWLLQLKTRLSKVERELEHSPPKPGTLSVKDLHHLQTFMQDLVENVEIYTESQLKRMRVQTQAIQTMCERMEMKLMEIDPPPVESGKPPARIVPLAPKQGFSNHKEKDRIIELHRQGWPLEKIAEELRLPRGEVQLIVNLS